MNSKLLLIAGMFCWSLIVGCNSRIPSDFASDQNAMGEDSLKLGSKIDSLHQWIVSNGVSQFDYKSKMLAYNNIQDIKAFKLQSNNDRFGLRDRIPSSDQFFSVEVVGYFFTDQKYYILTNCWDNQASHPKGFLISVTPTFEMSAISVYESIIDLVLDESIFKFSLFDDSKTQFVNFEVNPDMIYDDSYNGQGVVGYDSCVAIQEILPNLSENDRRLYKGCIIDVVVSCQNNVIGKFRDTTWTKVGRIKETHCFPETYEDYVFISSRNWYYSYVSGNLQNWKTILKPCDR